MEKGTSKAFAAHDNKESIFARETEMQGRIIRFLGNENLAEGRQIWIDKGYLDLFYKLLDKDQEFAEQVRLGHISPVLNRLEKKWLEQEENYNNEAIDKAFVEELRAFKLDQFSDKIVAAGVVVLSMLGSRSPKFVEESAPRPVSVHYDELKKLDSEATPERIDALLATFPEGLIGEIGSINFINEKYVIDPKYGMELNKRSQGLATASGGVGKDGTEIVFWRGMKGPTYGLDIFGAEIISVTKENTSSRAIWSRTLAHEISHAGDWKRSGRLSKAERTILKVAVYNRVQSEDRYISPYVESISNENAQEELDIKATEYWAEIGEAYFDGELNLPEADYKLVDEFVKKMDPNFDRDKALQARLEITNEMNKEQQHKKYKEFEAQFKILSPLMRDRYQTWLDQHELNAGKELDKTLQQQGRQELVNLLNSNLTSVERNLMFKYILFCQNREFLLASVQADKTGVKKFKTLPPLGEALEILFFDAQEIDERSKTFGNDRAEKLLAAMDQIVNAYDLDFTTLRAGLFTKDEKQQLFSMLNENSLPLLFNTDWRDENDNFLDLDYFVNNQ